MARFAGLKFVFSLVARNQEGEQTKFLGDSLCFGAFSLLVLLSVPNRVISIQQRPARTTRMQMTVQNDKRKAMYKNDKQYQHKFVRMALVVRSLGNGTEMTIINKLNFNNVCCQAVDIQIVYHLVHFNIQKCGLIDTRFHQLGVLRALQKSAGIFWTI